jgi:hypothetical protein
MSDVMKEFSDAVKADSLEEVKAVLPAVIDLSGTDKSVFPAYLQELQYSLSHFPDGNVRLFIVNKLSEIQVLEFIPAIQNRDAEALKGIVECKDLSYDNHRVVLSGIARQVQVFSRMFPGDAFIREACNILERDLSDRQSLTVTFRNGDMTVEGSGHSGWLMDTGIRYLQTAVSRTKEEYRKAGREFPAGQYRQQVQEILEELTGKE